MIEVSNKIRVFNATNNRVVAIVVTYNRKDLLVTVINALLNQSMACDIIIIDNASTDGTKDYLEEQSFNANPRVNYLYMTENLGGSGGFYEGIKKALQGQWKWFWLMDDDAIPESEALRNLAGKISNFNDIYGSVAISIIKGAGFAFR